MELWSNDYAWWIRSELADGSEYVIAFGAGVEESHVVFPAEPHVLFQASRLELWR
jgi:hypothetical protein